MKKCFMHMPILLGLLVFSATCCSYTLDTLEVGDLDTLLFSAKLPNSGDQTEVDWINSKIGANYTKDDYAELSNSFALIEDQSDIWVMDLGNTPAYFLVKTGNGNTCGYTHYLYGNGTELRYAVIDLGFAGIANVGKVSHIGTPGGAAVPEPAALILFGCGLIGLAGMGRKRMFK